MIPNFVANVILQEATVIAAIHSITSLRTLTPLLVLAKVALSTQIFCTCVVINLAMAVKLPIRIYA
jgi:hypothetical protein